MQLDLFGATENTAIHQSAPPVMSDGAWRPPEALAFDSALRRGELGDAINILNSLKVNAAARVLLSSGFAMGSMSNRASMMADVQSDLVAAARQGLTGTELLASKKIIQSASLMDVNLKIKEKEIDHATTTAKTGDVLGGNGTENRNDGRDGGDNRESLGAGLAGRRSDTSALGEVSERVGGANGGGEGYPGELGQSAASGSARDIADERNQGSAADYVLTEEDRIGLGGLAEKFQDNLQAIRVLRTLDAENRHAVDEEKRELARYVGWGGLKGVFDPDNKQWGRQHLALKALLSDEEWAAASRSQLDAFYTPPVIANAMYSAVSRFGFEGGRTLDPSVGVGNFFGLMPPKIRQNSALHGVELDILSSRIVSALYPNAKIAKATGFQAYKAGNIVVSGNHSGLVTSVVNGIVTQKINRDGEVALHAAAKLSMPVNEGDVVDIHYRMGFGEVKARERGGVGIAR